MNVHIGGTCSKISPQVLNTWVLLLPPPPRDRSDFFRSLGFSQIMYKDYISNTFCFSSNQIRGILQQLPLILMKIIARRAIVFAKYRQ